MEATRKSPRKTARKASALETVGVEHELEVTEMRKGVKSRKKKRGRGNSSCDDDDDVKISSLMATKRKRKPSEDDRADEEENMTPPSKKKGKGSVHESKSESDHVDAGVFTAGDGLGFATQVVETDVGVKMIEEELEDRQLSIDDDLPLTQLSSFRAQETDEGDALEVQEQERHSKPRVIAASSLPIVFGEKVNRTKVLLECEGDALDLSGDMGAVGRFTVNRPDDELLLDLKGVVYKTTIVPSNTYFVVNVGQMEAKVESIMTDFMQLRADTSWNENETMVEGTLKDFAFESDEEGERPAVDGDDMPSIAEEVKHEEGAAAADKLAKKKKPSTSGKVPVRKAAAVKSKVGKGKTSAKGGVGRKPSVKKAIKASIGKK
ncbi:uncharacterized protein [Physcomitrium patens]|uniref:DNA-binding protein BIN4 n=1 Tax=Physcomitrium patens TaxID=3218 RepID=A0A7I4E827_PHYPA|nr:DNA-binding protein BIN4-like isoform X2 [Physcomitrium patens]|eukprot:XP_024379826.1 DNA-binding protein BIN4-like isoform X2 [Physcomitrella patens]